MISEYGYDELSSDNIPVMDVLGEYEMSLKSRQKGLGSLIISLSLALIGGVFSPVFAALPDTGQTKCYNESAEITCPSPGQDYYGQDANYTINQPSYTKLDATGNSLPDSATSWAMVKDNFTGLVWENKTADGSIHDMSKTYTFNDAQNVFIVQLNSSKFGGYSDWRMPTRDELRFIVDFSKVGAPAINVGYFPNTKSGNYWSSSLYTGDEGYVTYGNYAWTLQFSTGILISSEKSGLRYVRAIRGINTGSYGNFVDNSNGTVTDTGTGLIWQQATGNMTWKEALSYCENLSLAGYTDWRLPNIRELAFLADLNRFNVKKATPAIDMGYFPDTNLESQYWSSSSTAYFEGQAWSVRFYDGYEGENIKTNSRYARCVRGGVSQTVIEKGNVNGDDKIDLADAILALRVSAGISISQTIYMDADVNGDKKIGIEEVIYILQKIAGLRP